MMRPNSSCPLPLERIVLVSSWFVLVLSVCSSSVTLSEASLWKRLKDPPKIDPDAPVTEPANIPKPAELMTESAQPVGSFPKAPERSVAKTASSTENFEALLNVTLSGGDGPTQNVVADFVNKSFERAPALGRINLLPPDAPAAGAFSSSARLNMKDFFILIQRCVGKWFLRQVGEALEHDPSADPIAVEEIVEEQVMQLLEKPNFEGILDDYSSSSSPALENLKKDDTGKPIDVTTAFTDENLLKTVGSCEIGEDIAFESPSKEKLTTARKTAIMEEIKASRSLSKKKGEEEKEEGWRRLKAFVDREKFTVILRDADGRHPWLGQIGKRFRQAFGLSSGVSLYYTPPSTVSGVPSHIDSMDVIVVQLAGKKQWVVEPSTRQLPLLKTVPSYAQIPKVRCGECTARGQKCVDKLKNYLNAFGEDAKHRALACQLLLLDNTSALAEVELREAGEEKVGGESVLPASHGLVNNPEAVRDLSVNALYIPRGFIHSTTTDFSPAEGKSHRLVSYEDEMRNEGSLHLSIGLEATPHKTLIEFLLEGLLKNGTTANGVHTGTAFYNQLMAEFPKSISFPPAVRKDGDGKAFSFFRTMADKKKVVTVRSLLSVLLYHLSKLNQFPWLRAAMVHLEEKEGNGSTGNADARSPSRSKGQYRSPTSVGPKTYVYVYRQLQALSLAMEKYFIEHSKSPNVPRLTWCRFIQFQLSSQETWFETIHLWYHSSGPEKCSFRDPHDAAAFLADKVNRLVSGGLEKHCGKQMDSRWSWTTMRLFIRLLKKHFAELALPELTDEERKLNKISHNTDSPPAGGDHKLSSVARMLGDIYAQWHRNATLAETREVLGFSHWQYANYRLMALRHQEEERR